MVPQDLPMANYMALLACICHPISAEKALVASGLIQRPGAVKKKSWSNDRLLDALYLKGLELKRTPTIDDINSDPDLPSGAIYGKRFGTYSHACELVHLTPNPKGGEGRRKR